MSRTDLKVELDRNWDDFIAQSTNPSIFQTRAWAELARIIGQKPVPVRVTDPSGVTKCVMLAVVRRSSKLLRGLGLQRILVEWGPVSVDPHAEVEALSKLVEYAHDLRAAEILVLTSSMSAQSAEKVSFSEVESDLNSHAVVDLPRDEEALWNQLDPRCRQAIRKAEDAGVEVRPGRIDEFFALYLGTRRRLQAPLRPYEFFKRLDEMLSPRGQAAFLSAVHDGRPIASLLLLMNHGYAWYFEGASDERYWHTRANSLLHWRAMGTLIQEGYRRYDLMLCPSPDKMSSKHYGLYIFKSQFGAKIEQVRTFTKFSVLKKPFSKLAYGSYNLFSKFQRVVRA